MPAKIRKKKQSEKERFKKFQKRLKNSKEGKIMDLLYDVRRHELRFEQYNGKSFLAAALSIACKGTKMEKDAKALINYICPEYFSPNGNNEKDNPEND